ncbi:Hypothetical protein H16_A3683 [Cupriavidus necator H16]|uniref:Uncharacterized protein n=1 Tax=Cupriavidus necator (strain ATCC 17699 / DSM 428 / KCTC 22496 / NCIMB 10442 / H16 / Stanier 337) TaxID=381666 RepID=Q0K5I1_CUPNH|nr:Hypothetical protein H16_A3683 [Cupriavidus necator H16]
MAGTVNVAIARSFVVLDLKIRRIPRAYTPNHTDFHVYAARRIWSRFVNRPGKVPCMRRIAAGFAASPMIRQHAT